MAKIGEGHAEAMFRLGLKELRNAISPSRESVAADEIGIYGTATQGEIAGARKGPGEGPEQESMGELRAAAQEKARGQEPHHGLPEAAKQQERGGMEM